MSTVPIPHAIIRPIKHQYSDFTGRTSRGSFWLFVAVYFIFALCISTIELVTGTIFMTVMSSFALMLPSLAITTRRLHDIGMSGWWQLVGFVPMIGLFVLALLLARRGSPEPNPYGEPDWLTPTTTEDESLTEPEVVFYDENR